MEQCYFSFMLFGRYFQLTKAKVFQILDNKDGWKIVFRITITQLNIIAIISGIVIAVMYAVFYDYVFLRWIFGIGAIVLLFISGYYFDKLSEYSLKQCFRKNKVNNSTSGSSNVLTEPSDYAIKRCEVRNKLNLMVNTVVNEIGVPLPKYDYKKQKFTVELPINKSSKGGGTVGSIKIIEFDLFSDALEYIISWRD